MYLALGLFGLTLLAGIFYKVSAGSGRSIQKSEVIDLGRIGAQKNGAPITVTATTSPDTACVEMGWSRRHSIQGYLAAQEHILTGGANIRRGGSGALALAWVAEGRSDGYLEAAMNCWDCLAGMLMVQEAGGSVLAFGSASGERLSTLRALSEPHPVRASTPALAELLDGALSFAAEPGQ